MVERLKREGGGGGFTPHGMLHTLVFGLVYYPVTHSVLTFPSEKSGKVRLGGERLSLNAAFFIG